MIKNQIPIEEIYDNIKKDLLKYKNKNDYNNGYCGIFAYCLYKALLKEKYDAIIIEVNNGYHYFVYCDNKSLDINGINEGIKTFIVPEGKKIHYRTLKTNEIKKRIKRKTGKDIEKILCENI